MRTKLLKWSLFYTKGLISPNYEISWGLKLCFSIINEEISTSILLYSTCSDLGSSKALKRSSFSPNFSLNYFFTILMFFVLKSSKKIQFLHALPNFFGSNISWFDLTPVSSLFLAPIRSFASSLPFSLPNQCICAKRSSIDDLVLMRTKLLKWSSFYTKGLISLMRYLGA